MKNKYNMLGRTMFETIAAMAVISMIAAGIYKLANNIMNRYKLSRVQTQVYTLQKTINDRFMAEGNYDTAHSSRHDGKSIWDILDEEGLLDSDISNGRHAFGGDITVGGVKIENQDEDKEASRYFIMFSGENTPGNVWTEVCMSFGDMDWLREGGSNLVKQCYGDCEIEDGDVDEPVEAGENGVFEQFSCHCTYKIPAPEAILSGDSTVPPGCDGTANILWIFE